MPTIRNSIFTISRLANVILATSVLMAGCSSRPHAPALQNEAVYRNSKEGFHFLAPEGWTQTAKADVPPGKAGQERLLVEYRKLKSDQPAAFQASLIDLGDSERLEDYLSGPGSGFERWQLKRPPEERSIGGASATRLVFVSPGISAQTSREVTAYRRGSRVYLFSGIFVTADTKTSEQIHRAVESIKWEK